MKSHALRSAKCAPQNAITAPRPRAASPASTPEMVGVGLGAEAACPAPARISTPTAIRNCRIRRGICPDTALCIRLAGKAPTKKAGAPTPPPRGAPPGGEEPRVAAPPQAAEIEAEARA